MLRRPLGDAHEWRLRTYGLARQFDNRLPFTGIDLDRQFGGASLEYRHIGLLAGRGNRLLIGVDAERQRDRRRRRVNVDGQLGAINFNQRERVTSVGAFAHDELGFTDRLRLVAGLRFDAVTFRVRDRFLADGDDSGRIRFEQLSPSLAAHWRAAPATSFYARISSGFETPTTTELANPTGGGGFNPNLDAERATGLEAGVKGTLRDTTRYELALFHIDVDDQLLPFEIPTAPGRFAFENAGSSTHQGLEASLATETADGWRLRAAHSWSELRFDRFRDRNGLRLDDRRLPGVPVHHLNLGLDYVGWSMLQLGADLRVIGPYFADNANAIRIPSHAVLDLRMVHRLRAHSTDVELSAGIANVLDRSYNDNVRLNANTGRFFEPAPGRNAYVELNVSF